MDEEGHLLLILHEVPKPEDEEVRRPFLLWGQPDGTWKSSPSGGGLAGLTEHLASYERAIHDLDDDVEAAASPRECFEMMKRAQPLLRATRNLLTVLEAARKARSDERRLIVARDKAIDLERGIDLTASDAKAGMDFTLAMNAEAQARAAHEAGEEARRLNRLAAFFLPLATLVAVFGINPPAEVLGMPGLWAVVLGGVGLGAVVWMSLLRRK
ncbi:hypothetical protein HAHE_23430 [Haloferula helveola]|uniref:CorA-like Mg2+ transporter protein n=2 Tax=Haloferula helveola TaxID=490095 RepID=A0ABM7RGL0_9BACT|nr:hypothetical protein HAHE_23430 [Haloferula helveola]